MAANQENKSEKIRRAIYGSPESLLKIGQKSIQCYVLDDGTAVLSGRGMLDALGIEKSHGGKLSEFINRISRNGIIDSDLAMGLNNPIKFTRPGRGGKPSNGYEATILTSVCRAILTARRNGLLNTDTMQAIAVECEIIIAAFSDVGIIATIYEITGYEKAKVANAYQSFLEKFLLKEAAAYVKRFPIAFFEVMCDLKGWAYEKGKTRYIPAMGHVINDVIYSRLAPNILDELKKLNPKVDGKRQHKQHSFLTVDVGVPALNEHIIGVMALARANSSWNKFYAQLSAAYPTYNNPQMFLFPPDQIADMIKEEERKEEMRIKMNELGNSRFNNALIKALSYNPRKQEEPSN